MADLKLPAQKPTSVGLMLKQEFIDPLGISQGELAKAMGVSRRTVNQLCGDKRGVTIDTALLLAKVLGTTPEFWLNLQHLNNMWVLENKASDEITEKLEKATTLIAA